MYDGVGGGGAAGESPYSLKDIFRVVWERLWIIILVPLVCVGTAVAFSLSQTPIYEAEAQLVVVQESVNSEQEPVVAGNVEGLQQVALTMVEAIPIRPLAEEVIKEEKLNTTPETFLGNLTVEQNGSTQLLALSYRSPDPREAQRAVNTAGDVASKRMSELSAGSANIRVKVLEYAVFPSAVSPNPLRSALLALIVGSMLGVSLAFLLEYLDDSWRSEEEVERVAGVPTFGSIPEFEVARARKSKGKAAT
jgi:capsular polysaccharide biosynthesis protein